MYLLRVSPIIECSPPPFFFFMWQLHIRNGKRIASILVWRIIIIIIITIVIILSLLPPLLLLLLRPLSN